MKRQFWLIGALTGLMVVIFAFPGTAEDVAVETAAEETMSERVIAEDAISEDRELENTEVTEGPGELLQTSDDLFNGDTDTDETTEETDFTEEMLFSEEADDQVDFSDPLTDSVTIVDSGYCGPNAEWTLDDQGTLVISGEDGEITKKATDYVRDRSQIKKVIIKEGITSIGDSAFADCYDLADIIIPDSVTSIGSRAFSCCYDLTGIKIPANVSSIGSSPFGQCVALLEINVSDDNTSYRSIDGVLYDKNCSHLIQCPGGKTSVSLPDGLTSIEASAFNCCDHLDSIVIPDTVNTIGHGAFYSCDSVKSIVIP